MKINEKNKLLKVNYEIMKSKPTSHFLIQLSNNARLKFFAKLLVAQCLVIYFCIVQPILDWKLLSG